jgi:predicted anti-sigma-YlaC factor YlaD
MMLKLRCRYTKARLSAYLKQELSVNHRRYVARHLESCPECQQRYQTMKQLSTELDRELPRFGAPTQQQLNAMWGNIQAELNAPITLKRRFAFNLGLVAVLVFSIVATPFLLGHRNMAVPTIDSRVMPIESITFTTPTSTPTAVALVSLTPSPASLFETELQNTPIDNGQ